MINCKYGCCVKCFNRLLASRELKRVLSAPGGLIGTYRYLDGRLDPFNLCWQTRHGPIGNWPLSSSPPKYKKCKDFYHITITLNLWTYI
jgi:hypothetical protein